MTPIKTLKNFFRRISLRTLDSQLKEQGFHISGKGEIYYHPDNRGGFQARDHQEGKGLALDIPFIGDHTFGCNLTSPSWNINELVITFSDPIKSRDIPGSYERHYKIYWRNAEK